MYRCLHTLFSNNYKICRNSNSSQIFDYNQINDFILFVIVCASYALQYNQYS